MQLESPTRGFTEALIQAGRRDLQVAEFEESVALVVEAMLNFERFAVIQSEALQIVEVAILDGKAL